MVEALGPQDPTEVSGYVLRGKLGEGGMGSVYLSHSRGGQPVALKVIRREFAQNPEFLRRFAREIAAARRVQGAYTAPVLDSSTEGPQPWLASAYVPGPSLGKAVLDHGPLPLRSVLLLVAGVAEALESVHRADVVHRDLKPSNVLLAERGPCVIDFGIARATDTTALTSTDVRLGTPAYMAPEQAEGRPAGPALDVFALGLVAFFAATGGHPFGDGDGHALLYRIVSQEPDLTPCPQQLRPLIARCLAKNPAERPRPAEVIDECHRIAADEGVPLARDDGWWLPPAVASDVTRHTPPPAADPRGAFMAPSVDRLPTVPDRRAPWPGPDDGSGAPAGRSRAAQLASTLFGGPRRRAKRTGAVAVALAVIAAGVFLTMRSDGGRPTDSPGWALQKTDVALKIPAPPFDEESSVYLYGGNVCTGPGVENEPSVYIDLNALKVHANGKDAKDSDIPSTYTLQYSDCSDGTGTSGTGPRTGFRLIPDRAVWGVVHQHAISGDTCERAAEAKKLGDQITVKQIQARQVLHVGMGLCVLLHNQTLALLWFTGDRVQAGNDSLRDFTVLATQWQPR
jgi:hypothetical protein